MNFDVNFDPSCRWCCDYLRNNKSSGFKNLRCFPCCRPAGHMSKGYCGSEIKASLLHPCSIPATELLVLGRFLPVDDEIDSSEENLQLSVAQIEASVRSGLLFQPLIKVSEGQTNSGSLELSFRPKVWRYQWTSNKWRSTQLHTFQIIIMCQAPQYNDIFQSIKAFSSPLFSVSSQRRQHTRPVAKFPERYIPDSILCRDESFFMRSEHLVTHLDDEELPPESDALVSSAFAHSEARFTRQIRRIVPHYGTTPTLLSCELDELSPPRVCFAASASEACSSDSPIATIDLDDLSSAKPELVDLADTSSIQTRRSLLRSLFPETSLADLDGNYSDSLGKYWPTLGRKV